jgi:hypothetical protein
MRRLAIIATAAALVLATAGTADAGSYPQGGKKNVPAKKHKQKAQWKADGYIGWVPIGCVIIPDGNGGWTVDPPWCTLPPGFPPPSGT